MAKVVYFSRTNGAGGRLHFKKFETSRIDECLEFLAKLLGEGSDSSDNERYTIKATGGGAYLFYKEIESKLGVRVVREDEMDCLIKGNL